MTEPRIRFPEFTDSWELHNLGDFAKEIKRVEKDSVAPVMMISSGNGFIYQADRYSRDNAGSSLKKYIELHKEEFAYNHGYSKAKIYGSVFMLTEEEKARIPYVYHCFSVNKAHKPFLAMLLNRSQLNKELVKYITSTARMDGLLNISFEDFMKVEFYIPSKQEQKKVSDTLATVDEVITTLTEEVRLWEEKKKGVMQKIFSQEVRFKDENGEDYPEWEEKRFYDITYPAGERNRKNIPHETYAITNIHGFIPQKEAHDDFGYMKEVDKSAYIIVKPNSFGYNPARINVGSLGYYNGEKDVIVSSLYEVFKTSNEVYNEFLLYWFKTNIFKRWVERLQEGSVRLYFYYDKLRECTIKLPCLEEQQKIADCLSSIDEVIALKKQKLETWKNIKKGLLQQMFV